MKRPTWPWVALLMSFLTPSLHAEPVTTIRNHGDSSNRVDLVFLGDGYTSEQLPQFAKDVERLVEGFFAQQPFSEYQRYFNVHRIDVTSAESGADHPEIGTSGVQKNTAFDATYYCNGLDRLICVDVSRVEAVLSASLPSETQRDFAVVVVNDTMYGGSGGRIAVASLDSSVIELILHEFGHSFGLLGDEYEQQPPSCDLVPLPEEPNISRVTQREAIKWNHGGGPPGGWIDPSTELPTSPSFEEAIGAFKGARYCSSGLYRPTLTSKMRELGQAYKPVNEEQLIKRVYNFASPVDAAVPNSPTVAIPFAGVQAFELQIPQPMTHDLSVVWLVDQLEQQRGSTSFQLDTSSMTPGEHSVQAVVKDDTEKVRYDEQNVLTDTHTWQVSLGAAPATAFASFQGGIQLLRKGRPLGSFNANGRLVLKDSSNGIRPQREPFTVTINAGNEPFFSQTLAGGKLRLVAPKTFEYRSARPRSGLNLVRMIRTNKPRTYSFRLEGRRLDLQNIATDTVTLALTIGDDADQIVSVCRLARSRWLRCP